MNAEGYSPLSVAAQGGHLEAVRLLLTLGNATANHVTNSGWSPLLSASHNGHTQVVDMLVELGGADVHATLSCGETALDLALQNDHLDTAALLVVHGCEPTLEDHPAGSAERLALQRGLSLRGPSPPRRRPSRNTAVNEDALRTTSPYPPFAQPAPRFPARLVVHPYLLGGGQQPHHRRHTLLVPLGSRVGGSDGSWTSLRLLILLLWDGDGGARGVCWRLWLGDTQKETNKRVRGPGLARTMHGRPLQRRQHKRGRQVQARQGSARGELCKGPGFHQGDTASNVTTAPQLYARLDELLLLRSRLARIYCKIVELSAGMRRTGEYAGNGCAGGRGERCNTAVVWL